MNIYRSISRMEPNETTGFDLIYLEEVYKAIKECLHKGYIFEVTREFGHRPASNTVWVKCVKRKY